MLGGGSDVSGQRWNRGEVIVVSGRSITRLAGRAIAVISTASKRAIGETGALRAFTLRPAGLRRKITRGHRSVLAAPASDRQWPGVTDGLTDGSNRTEGASALRWCEDEQLPTAIDGVQAAGGELA